MVYGDGSKTMIITATPSHRERKVGHLEIRMTYDRTNLLETFQTVFGDGYKIVGAPNHIY